MRRRGETMDWTQIITVGAAAIIAAVGAFITGIVTARGGYKKQLADAFKTSAEAEAIALKSSTDKRAADIKAMGAVMDDLSARYEKLSELYDALRDHSAEDIKDLEGRIDVLEQERRDYLASAKRYQDTAVNLQGELVKANAKIAELTARVADLEGERERDRREIEAKNRVIADYQGRLEVAIAELDRERKGGKGL